MCTRLTTIAALALSLNALAGCVVRTQPAYYYQPAPRVYYTRPAPRVHYTRPAVVVAQPVRTVVVYR
jgi:hypothetical protein